MVGTPGTVLLTKMLLLVKVLFEPNGSPKSSLLLLLLLLLLEKEVDVLLMPPELSRLVLIGNLTKCQQKYHKKVFKLT